MRNVLLAVTVYAAMASVATPASAQAFLLVSAALGYPAYHQTYADYRAQRFWFEMERRKY